MMIAGIIGLFGNSCSLRLFSRKKDHKIFHHLLLLLAIFDLVSQVIFPYKHYICFGLCMHHLALHYAVCGHAYKKKI